MEKQAFLGEQGQWWLLEDQVDFRIEEVRTQVGSDFGWDRRWFENPDRLSELYRSIEDGDRDLLTQLDYATDTDAQLEWMGKLAALTHSAQPDAATVETGGDETGRTAEQEQPAGAWDDNWQMMYRVTSTGGYEFAFSDDRRTVRPGTNWMSAEEAAAATTEGAAIEENSTTEQEGQEEAAAAWDDNWQMMYRVTSTGEYEYAFSDDQRTVRPGTNWMSQDIAAAARGDGSVAQDGPEQDTAQQAESAAQVEVTFEDLPPEVAEVLETAVQGAMSSLAPENLSSLATELGIDEDQLQNMINDLPADFENILKAQAAQLAQ